MEPEVFPLIDKIAKIVLEWEEELSKKFRHIKKGGGRPLYSSEDSPFVTSVETYLRGELATYSKRTLELYYENLLNQKTENINQILRQAARGEEGLVFCLFQMQ